MAIKHKKARCKPRTFVQIGNTDYEVLVATWVEKENDWIYTLKDTLHGSYAAIADRELEEVYGL
jgi:hypothetical protein